MGFLKYLIAVALVIVGLLVGWSALFSGKWVLWLIAFVTFFGGLYMLSRKV